MRVVNGKVVLEPDDIKLGRPKKARGRVWAKLLEDVDTTKENGFAFQGRFLRVRGDPAYIDDTVPVGSFIVAAEATGSTNHPWTDIALYKVTADGIEELYRNDFVRKSDKIIAINDIAEILKKEKGQEGEDDELMKAIEELFNKFGKQRVLEYIEKLRGD